ncbi:MAG: DJ-1/PfpI family protein [Burkholderiaceae bacterium]|jgi:transcriptional regulator GlxA family with amidase domain
MKFCVLLYDDMEPIDLATFGVLSMARRIEPSIEVTTIAARAGVIVLANGLKVVADHGYAEAPPFDVLIVGGGPGWSRQAESSATLDFARQASVAGKTLVSVCTGAMILAAAGLLDGRRATTKYAVVPPETSPLELMRQRYPRIRTQKASVVDEGTVVTGGGVTLCIDTILHVLDVHLGEQVAAETARIMEYSRARRANQEALPRITGASGGQGV